MVQKSKSLLSGLVNDLNPSDGGWKYIQILITVGLVVAGAFAGRLWDVGVGTPSRQEIVQTMEQHGRLDSDKFNSAAARLGSLEEFQRGQSEKVFKLEAQLLVLDSVVQTLRQQHQEFRTELRREFNDIKATLKQHRERAE